jgi:spartin
VLHSGTARRYVFHATRDDAEFTLEIPVTPETSDDVELFHSVLVGYATDLRDDSVPPAPAPGVVQNGISLVVGQSVPPEDDLRGRFVLVNEDNGEIVSMLDRSVKVHEDPSLGERGHEGDPVVVELPEGAGISDDIEVCVRTIPPEDRDWMMKGCLRQARSLLFFLDPIQKTHLIELLGATTLAVLFPTPPLYSRAR